MAQKLVTYNVPPGWFSGKERTFLPPILWELECTEEALGHAQGPPDHTSRRPHWADQEAAAHETPQQGNCRAEITRGVKENVLTGWEMQGQTGCPKLETHPRSSLSDFWKVRRTLWD